MSVADHRATADIVSTTAHHIAVAVLKAAAVLPTATARTTITARSVVVVVVAVSCTRSSAENPEADDASRNACGNTAAASGLRFVDGGRRKPRSQHQCHEW